MDNLNKLRDIDALKIKLATPDEILSWSYGEVTKPETINYRTFKPEKDGLFCEKIFGPVKDYECYCGKYKRVRYKGVVCDRCGVQVTTSRVRRERMGHINLASPVAHVWMFKNIPSVMATLLGLAPRSLELVVYFSSFIVTDIDYDAKKEVLKRFEQEAADERERVHQEIEAEINLINEEGEAKVKSLSKDPEDKWSDALKKKASDIRAKVQHKAEDAKARELLEQEKAELEVRKKEKKVHEVDMHIVMTDKEYIDLEEYLDEFCEVSIGAEAIQKILSQFDIQKAREEIKAELQDAKSTKADKLRKRLKVIDSFIQGEVEPTSMIITVLPVMPPDLRPMVQIEGGRFATSDLNDLYRRIINRNNRLKRLLELGAPDVIVRNEKRMLQEAVDALFDSSKVRKTRTRERKTYRSIADSIKGKQGHFRANLLGKRVDYSGRAVIVAGPNLKMNECGLPTEMALELFRPFLIREIMNRGLAPNMKTAKYVLEEKVDEVYSILEELVSQRPILLNRAPTLHRLSIQAFYPKLTNTKAVQLHPVVCAGFNADFDGDQMAVHLPLSEKAVDEAVDLMLSTNNLLKPADGAVITIPSKEMVLGIYYLTSINKAYKPYNVVFSSKEEALSAYNNAVVYLRQPIKLLINNEILDTTPGRLIFNEFIPEELGFINKTIAKGAVKDLVKDSFGKIGSERTINLIDDLKDYGFRYSTVSGVSLSIFDCEEPTDLHEVIEKAKSEIAAIEQNYYMGLITQSELGRLSHKVWQEVTNHFDETILPSLHEENPVKMIITAGAGKASPVQMRQISAIKGLIADPSGQLIDMPVFGNYSVGMSSFDYFLTGRGTRRNYMDKGLGTADAGYLTRRLVNVAQDVLVREEDCGTTEGRCVKRGQDTPLTSWNKRLIGRTSLNDVKDNNKIIVKKDEIITSEQASLIEKSDLPEVFIRAAENCKAEYGVCKKCYGVNLSNEKEIEIGAAVGIIAAQSIGEPGTQLTMRTFHSGGIATTDITQGLPRIEELFEVRNPRNPGLLSTVSGKVSIDEDDDHRVLTLIPTDKNQESVVHKLDANQELTVADGDLVAVGTQLTTGYLNLQEMYTIRGPKATQDYILEEVQKVYGSQGVAIDDKHVEIIIKQMFNRVKIKKSGDTTFLPGEILTKYRFVNENEKVKALKGVPAESVAVLLGITRVSRMSESWLDAASFEETSNVLTESAISGRIDKLIGLKENVIIGRKIPVGEKARIE
jgi:DNA-directed RNA polymerase subunit beta'